MPNLFNGVIWRSLSNVNVLLIAITILAWGLICSPRVPNSFIYVEQHFLDKMLTVLKVRRVSLEWR